MKFSKKSAFILLVIFLSGATTSFAQSDTVKLDKHIPILNHKYFFDFPAAAMVSPRVADIMAADPNENKETRIIMDNDKMRLVFFAQELFAHGGSTLFADISGQIEPDFNFQRKVLSDSDSLMAILSTPTLFDSTASAILVNSLMVKSPDNTVSRIDVYINPEAYSKKEEYVKLSEAIFKTIIKGTRRVDLKAREESYKIVGVASNFLFKLPENYYVTVDEKYDFGVFKLTKYRKDLDDTTYTSITIYTGHHPSYFYKEYGYTEDKAVKTKGLFLQNPVDWLYFKDPEQNFYLKEQFVPADAIETGLILHVAMLSNKKEVIDELTKIVEGIKVTK